jgi:hypothetical protein
LLDAEVVEQLRGGIRLIFWSDAGLERSAEIARAGGRDDLETFINKKPSQRCALVIAAWCIMKNQYRRAFAMSDIFDRPILGGDYLGCRIQVHHSCGAPGLEEGKDTPDREEAQNNQKKSSAWKKSGFHDINVSQGG